MHALLLNELQPAIAIANKGARARPGQLEGGRWLLSALGGGRMGLAIWPATLPELPSCFPVSFAVFQAAPPRVPGQVGAALVFNSADAPAVAVASTGQSEPQRVDYIRDVNPVLAKLGCNAGTCHGSREGKKGFKLSLRGYDPIYDLRALADHHAPPRGNLSLAAPPRAAGGAATTGRPPQPAGARGGRRHWLGIAGGHLEMGLELRALGQRLLDERDVDAEQHAKRPRGDVVRRLG